MLLNRLQQSGKYQGDKKIEFQRGDIAKYNAILSSFFQNHLAASQKIFDTRVKAYEALWEKVLKLKEEFPAGIALVYQLLMDDELNAEDAFQSLDKNPKFGPTLRSYDHDKEMIKLVDSKSLLPKFRPYIADKSHQLFVTYNSLYGRITHSFIWNYQKGILYNWKKDEALISILQISLTANELKFVMQQKSRALNSLAEMLEYKIMADMREQLQISDSQKDSIQYIKDIDRLIHLKD
ncbi:hypothetical protein [Pedobacter sp.]